MDGWGFLTNQARALIYIDRYPDARLRDLAAALDVTERTAFGLVADLSGAGYVIKEREGRRNRYHVQPQLPIGDTIVGDRAIGEVLPLAEAAQAVHDRRSTDLAPVTA